MSDVEKAIAARLGITGRVFIIRTPEDAQKFLDHAVIGDVGMGPEPGT